MTNIRLDIFSRGEDTAFAFIYLAGLDFPLFLLFCFIPKEIHFT